MFPNNPLFVDKLLQTKQDDIMRELPDPTTYDFKEANRFPVKLKRKGQDLGAGRSAPGTGMVVHVLIVIHRINGILKKERKTDMNTKLNLASIVVTIFLIATACSPDSSSLPILDQAQPEEENYEIAPLVPVTGVDAGENVYDYEQEALGLPEPKIPLRTVCPTDIHRQGKCEEKEQS